MDALGLAPCDIQWRISIQTVPRRWPPARIHIDISTYRRTLRSMQRQSMDRFGGGSVMVWGAIWFGGRSQLLVVDGNLTANGYLATVLSNQIISYVQLHNHAIFMHDNARPHVAHVCQDYLRAHNVQVLDWPRYFSDMNPIELLWDHLDRKVRLRNPLPRNLAQLQVTSADWTVARYPQFRINRLILPVSRQIWDLGLANGSCTRY